MNAREFLKPLDLIDGRKLGSLAGLHAADTLACLAAGAGTLEGRALAVFYAGSGLCEPFASAAAAAAIIRLTEWDDIHVPSCVTPGSVAVPVALVLARDDVEFAASVCAGYGVGVALGEAVGGVSALPETWPGLFAAPAIAAITASTALGLSAEKRAHALVMALAGSSGRHGCPVGMPSARWFVVGEAALKGMRAALAAQAGVKGDLNLLSPQWLKAQSAAATELKPLPPDAIASVGLKPYVSARQGINAIEAFHRFLSKGAEPSSIEEIRVSLPPEAVGVVSRPLNPKDRLSTIAHLGLQLGIAAFEPDRLADVARAEPFSAQALALAAKVSVTPDETLAAEAPGRWAAKLAVRMGSEWHESVCLSVPGDPGAENAACEIAARKIASACRGEDTARAIEAIAGLNAGTAKPAVEMMRRTLRRVSANEEPVRSLKESICR